MHRKRDPSAVSHGRGNKAGAVGGISRRKQTGNGRFITFLIAKYPATRRAGNIHSGQNPVIELKPAGAHQNIRLQLQFPPVRIGHNMQRALLVKGKGSHGMRRQSKAAVSLLCNRAQVSVMHNNAFLPGLAHFFLGRMHGVCRFQTDQLHGVRFQTRGSKRAVKSHASPAEDDDLFPIHSFAKEHGLLQPVQSGNQKMPAGDIQNPAPPESGCKNAGVA